jgi:SPX domain protein involved in polyphosphate accumulation
MEENFRFERKFLTQELSQERVEWIIKNHSMNFKEIFLPRTINNIYFDTLGLDNLNDNIDGQTLREKYRIRWYGNMFGKIEKPTLEVKIKNGSVGKKVSFLLNSFELNDKFSRNTILNSIDKKIDNTVVKLRLINMQPVLLNSYSRSYYLSNDKKVRLTIDKDLTYSSIRYFKNNFTTIRKDKSTVILEVKYNSADEVFVKDKIDFSPLMLTKSSKYVQGYVSLY